MIRKLTEQDREKVLQYLNKESAFNIFIIGDIEHFGFDKDFQHIYGEFTDDNEFLSVLLFYRIHAVYYSHKHIFNKVYMTYFDLHKPQFMSSKGSLQDLFLEQFPTYKAKPMHFCKATSLEQEDCNDSLQIKLVQTKEDASKLYDLLATISEFNTSKESKEEFIQGKMTSINMGTTMVLEEDGKFVSTVATTAETTKDAMVVGVATHKDYRKKGYASILMSALMKRYFNDLHKDLCLFYDNPKAGKIYLRMGFKDIGKWVMYEPK